MKEDCIKESVQKGRVDKRELMKPSKMSIIPEKTAENTDGGEMKWGNV